MAIPQLDPAFGHDGFVPPTSTSAQLAYPDLGLVRARAGRLIVGGTASVDGGERFYLAAFEADGGPSSDFGSDGQVVSDFGARGWALALQPAPEHLPMPDAVGGERVLIGGTIQDPETPDATDNVFAVARYTIGGKPDSQFGSGGLAWLDAIPPQTPAEVANDERIWGLAVQPSRGILAAGSGQMDSGARGVLVRFGFDGKLDASFGQHIAGVGPGRVIYPAVDAPVGANGDLPDTAFQCITLQPNGRILVGGVYGAQFLVMRLTEDGGVDHHFGQGGRVLLTLGFGWASPPRLLVQEDERIVLVATVISPTGSGGDDDVTAIVLARLLPNGDLDRTFGQLIPGSFGPPANRVGGKVDHRLGWTILNIAGTGFEGANDAILQRSAHDAFLVVGGTQTTSAFRGNFLVARFGEAGDDDTLFGGPVGAVLTRFPGANANGAGYASAAVYDAQADSLTVAGGVLVDGSTGVGLARYLLT